MGTAATAGVTGGRVVSGGIVVLGGVVVVSGAPPVLPGLVGVTLVAMCAWWRSDLGHDRGDVPAVLGFVGNWWYVFRHQDYFTAVGRPTPFQHLWSLGVEEQFYLVWPVMLWLL